MDIICGIDATLLISGRVFPYHNMDEGTAQTRFVFIARRRTVNITAVEKALKGSQATANPKVF